MHTLHTLASTAGTDLVLTATPYMAQEEVEFLPLLHLEIWRLPVTGQPDQW